MSAYRNPTPTRPQQVRAWRACRGLRAWRARKETHETEEARRVPAALTARAKQEGRRNDKKRRLDDPGVGLAHSIQRQGASPEAGEGANKSTQSAQATSAVRTTESRLANLPAGHSREGIHKQTPPVRRLVSVAQPGRSAPVFLPLTEGRSQWRGRGDVSRNMRRTWKPTWQTWKGD